MDTDNKENLVAIVLVRELPPNVETSKISVLDLARMQPKKVSFFHLLFGSPDRDRITACAKQISEIHSSCSPTGDNLDRKDFFGQKVTVIYGVTKLFEDPKAVSVEYYKRDDPTSYTLTDLVLMADPTPHRTF